jgi:hypothetical protein
LFGFLLPSIGYYDTPFRNANGYNVGADSSTGQVSASASAQRWRGEIISALDYELQPVSPTSSLSVVKEPEVDHTTTQYAKARSSGFRTNVP